MRDDDEMIRHYRWERKSKSHWCNSKSLSTFCINPESPGGTGVGGGRLSVFVHEVTFSRQELKGSTFPMDNEQELFKGAAILAMNRRFPSTDKVMIFESKDVASDVVMASMSLKPYKEYNSARSGSKIASAYVNDKPCLLRYVDLNPNVDSQGDILVYLSFLKTFKHSQLEDAKTIGVIELGSGKSKETKVRRYTFLILPKSLLTLRLSFTLDEYLSISHHLRLLVFFSSYKMILAKIIIISEVGHEVTPLLSYVEEKPSSHNDWRKRIKISLDIARGLEHLHRHEIVHG